MTKISELHRRWNKDTDYKDAYDALGEEFDLARTLVEARTAAGLSQSPLARRMKASQSYIARIEGGKVRPFFGPTLAQASAYLATPRRPGPSVTSPVAYSVRGVSAAASALVGP